MTRVNHAHRAFIRSLPCAVCFEAPLSECAHVRLSTFGEWVIPQDQRGGMGMKPYDLWTVPLCSRHHRIQHTLGEMSFWETIDINPIELADALYRNSGHKSAALGIIQRRRNGSTLL